MPAAAVQPVAQAASEASPHLRSAEPAAAANSPLYCRLTSHLALPRAVSVEPAAPATAPAFPPAATPVDTAQPRPRRGSTPHKRAAAVPVKHPSIKRYRRRRRCTLLLHHAV